MKILFTKLIFILLNFSVAVCQEQSTVASIGIMPVTSIPSYGNPYTEHVRQQIAHAFASKTRFAVVDRTKLDAIFSERELQKHSDFVEGTIADQGKSIGAQYLVNGSLVQITHGDVNTPSSELRKNREGQLYTYSYYRLDRNVTVDIDLQLIEVSTGAVKSTKRISQNTTYKGTESQRPDVGACIVPTIQRLSGRIKVWVNEMFPVEMKIVEVLEYDKKGRPKILLVTGGADMDFQRSTNIISNTSSELEVVEKTILEFDGREIERSIAVGRVVVEKVEGELSECKIRNNADAEAIQQKLNEGKTLYLRIISY